MQSAADSAGENESADSVAQRVDTELGVAEWWTPLNRRRPEHSGPRTTEEGLKVPAWYRDEEAESQQWLAANGVVLDG